MGYKAVFQLDSGDEAGLKKAVGQINNALNAIDALDIELVLHGRAVQFLKNDNVVNGSVFAAIISRNVKVIACANALLSAGLTREQLFSWVEVVPSAVAHIIVRQASGWAYIKVG